jgi:hypothetical protein
LTFTATKYRKRSEKASGKREKDIRAQGQKGRRRLNIESFDHAQDRHRIPRETIGTSTEWRGADCLISPMRDFQQKRLESSSKIGYYDAHKALQHSQMGLEREIFGKPVREIR